MHTNNPPPWGHTELGWHGQVQLAYTRRDHTTHLAHCQVKAPLKLQRPFYPEGGEVCHSAVLHTAGGVVGGDRLSFDLQLQPNAHALLTTAAAGKIYRSKGPQARQGVYIRLAPGAVMEWLPQETIVFNQALYRQDLRVELEPGATWVGWEMTRLGRSARGEKFLEGNWQSYTEVWQQNRPLWIDRQGLPGGEVIWRSPHGLAGCPVVGTLVWIGPMVEPSWVEKVRQVWQDKQQGEVGITRLQQGILCRYRGNSTGEMRRRFVEVWKLLRPALLGRPACLPRVWPNG